MKRRLFLIPVLSLLTIGMAAQERTLTLEECRRMAIAQNKDLEQFRTKLEMAGYDRKIAAANYFPKVTAYGTVQYISGTVSLVDPERVPKFSGMGDKVQQDYNSKLADIQKMLDARPELAEELRKSPLWQSMVNKMNSMDVAGAVNAIGSDLDATIGKTVNQEIPPIMIGAIAVQQPIFYGGKIVAANKMAAAAEELARQQYDGEYDEILVAVDQAYWQIVSVAGKKRLAESYADLLHKMEGDVNTAIVEGVATQADALKIKVKANEADMMLTKATNGLGLAKMLLCKQIGLPLDAAITLADETLDAVPLPGDVHDKTMEQVLADRPETRQLELAGEIFNQKVNIAKSDMLPKVILTGNYIAMSPNLSKGLTSDWNGRITGGVLVTIPIFHGTEALQKTNKAKAEATIYQTKYDDACNLINLQVTQLRKQHDEALARLTMAESNLFSAEENLRMATIGFEEGVIDSNTALAAQTAWLQAHSEYVDSGIEVQMNNSNLLKAEASYKSDIDK